MQPYTTPHTAHLLRLGFLFWCSLLLTGSPASSVAQGKKHEHAGHHHAGEVCRGFVVLPNGFAVLSAPAGAQPEATHTGAPMAEKGHTAGGASQHLMGYTHGQAIVPKEGMLCVSIGNATAQTWTATGQKGTPMVTVQSLKGALTRSNRTSAAFDLAVKQGSTAVDMAQVRILVRMPHHDRRLPGGHGPANDPDVKGLEAQAAGQGRYSVPLIDFTMSGPWLFEIHVQRDAAIHKVYMAAEVGEE